MGRFTPRSGAPDAYLLCRHDVDLMLGTMMRQIFMREHYAAARLAIAIAFDEPMPQEDTAAARQVATMMRAFRLLQEQAHRSALSASPDDASSITGVSRKQAGMTGHRASASRRLHAPHETSFTGGRQLLIKTPWLAGMLFLSMRAAARAAFGHTARERRGLFA